MKFLCFILSFHVFFLSTVPCCLDDHCNDEPEQGVAHTQVEVKAETQEQNHEDDEVRSVDQCL